MRSKSIETSPVICRGGSWHVARVRFAYHDRFIALAFVLFLFPGCDVESNRSPETESVDHVQAEPQVDGDKAASGSEGGVAVTGTESNAANDVERDQRLEVAELARQKNDLATASRLVNQQLLLTPEDAATLMLAGKIAADRNDFDAAIELVSSIPLEVECLVESTALLLNWYLRSGDYGKAVRRLQISSEVASLPAETQLALRQQLWTLLNRLGRRQEASSVADDLCRSGYFHRDVLLSLLRRGDAFPIALQDDSPDRHFYPGLGLARWFFTQGEFERALQILGKKWTDPEDGQADQAVAAHALRGRLLAEMQLKDEFVSWCRESPPECRQLSDYWIALGIFFFDHQQLDASLKALMEGVFLDPTDDDGCHRLARVLDSIPRPQEAALMRQHAIRVATLKNTAGQLSLNPDQSDLAAELPAQLVSIARPFEAIGWALSNLPAGNESKRSSLMQQFAALLADPSVPGMSSDYAMMELDRQPLVAQDVLARLPELPRATLGSEQFQSERNSVVDTTGAEPRFVDVSKKLGLEFRWYSNDTADLDSIPMHEMMGGGIAVCDFDLDGKPDVYFAQGSGEPPDGKASRSNQFYRNQDAGFLDVTPLCETMDFGYSSGIAAGDVNQDGFPDLFVGALGRNRLLINNGDGTYSDATRELGDMTPQFTSSLAIADLNGDGMPDLYECVYVEMEDGFRLPDRNAEGEELAPNPNDFYAEADRWFLNLGNGAFALQEIDRKLIQPGTALGLIVTDMDGDGANDVFVANDARPNHLLMRFSPGKVSNVADLLGLGYGFRGFSNSCMGIASGDFNRDGRFDLHVTNFLNESNNLFLQREGGLFSDYSVRFKLNPVCEPYTGFGIKKIDIDRNGWPDFVVTNGHVFDHRDQGIDFQMQPQILMNEGSRLRMIQNDDSSGYFGQRFVGRSLSLIDFDGDRDLDLIVGHLDAPAALLQNCTDTVNQAVQVELVGAQTERDATGCRVTLQFGEQAWTDWVVAGDGYLSTDQSILDFGIGTATESGILQVSWPSGKNQHFDGIKPGERYLIVEGNEEIWLRDDPVDQLEEPK